MSTNDTIQPRITVLDREQIQRIHEYSLRILSTIGVRIDSERARDVFAQASPPASVDGARVIIPPELVAWALDSAPSSVEIYNRLGDLTFRLGEGQTQARFGVGVTALYYQDPETDDVEPFTRQHMARVTRLGETLKSFDIISTPGIVQDVRPEISDLYATLEMAANTVKPLAILISEEDRFPDVLDLLEHLYGDLSSRPFIVPYFNPISPLVINKGTADKMFTTIERGLPFMYSNYGMTGATTPITPAGALVQLNAELLAGLTLSQLIKEGTPVILGCLPAYFDMQGMGSFYDAHSYLINLACAEMMAHYGLPHCGTSGSGIGWGADLIAAGHQWTNHLISCLGKVGLAPFVGDNLGSKAFSPTLIVYADEIIAQTRRLAQGFAFDEDAVAFDDIEHAGPGGNYLTSDLTLKLFRNAYYRSSIWRQLTLEEWQGQGQPRADDLLRTYTQRLLEDARPPEDHGELMRRGEEFVHSLGF
jgi:trimethylamine--corrinoid protein Co-methyltransferase